MPFSVGMGKVKKQGDFANVFYHYTQSTSMHGLKYVGDVSLKYTARFFWLVAFSLAVISAAYFIHILNDKYQHSPVIMSLSPSPTFLNNIPFPALTICNMNNVRKSNAESILKNGPLLKSRLIKDICENRPDPDEKDLGNITASWEFMKKLIVEVTQPCHEMLLSCEWNGEPYYCPDLFNPTISDEGMCCSFNKPQTEYIFRNPMDLSDINVTFPYKSTNWTPDTGYSENSPKDSLPWRPAGAGSQKGLTIIVNAETSEYFCSSEMSLGFKLLLHNPIETPTISSFGLTLQPGQESRVTILPNIITAEPSIKNIEVEKRLCYFINEKFLRFYRTYTHKNCERECETNYTLNDCDCVLFYMPKDKDTRVCSRRDWPCADNAIRRMNTQIFPHPCNCLPGCHEIIYSTDVSSAPIMTTAYTRNSLHFADKRKEELALIHVFFTDTQFTTTLRTKLFGFAEFLSNIGGLLGIFLGFSALSAVEIFYYAFLRALCSVQMKLASPGKDKKVYPPVYPYIE